MPCRRVRAAPLVAFTLTGTAARSARMRSNSTLRRFVVGVLRHEFTPERLGEDGLVQMIDQLAGAGGFGRRGD